AVAAVPRLVDLEVKPATIGPALSLIIAQRLVRKLCPKCRKPKATNTELKNKIQKALGKMPERGKKENYKHYTLYEAVGCSECNNFGYRGRVGIFEFLLAGPEMEEVILKQASEVVLRELARKQEMVTMQEDGVLKVLAGMTTLEEIEKATGPIAWG
ncbi:MAG: hypothetical protein AAB686_03595, partial [Patescibacteria group bacterium]